MEDNVDPLIMALELQAAKYFKLDIANIDEKFYARGLANRSKSLEQESPDQDKTGIMSHHYQSSSTSRQNCKSNKLSVNNKQQTNTKQSRSKPKKSLGTANQTKIPIASKRSNEENHTHRQQQQKTLSDDVVIESPILSCSNSLPSISSSPSLSPSLVCPHLSLNDLLIEDANNIKLGSSSGDVNQLKRRSPHTIGLCPKCRLSPPPNLHSPLSPVFAASQSSTKKNQSDLTRLRRGQSDHHLSRYPPQSRQLSSLYQQQKMTSSGPSRGLSTGEDVKPIAKKNTSLSPKRIRDDSLDYFLDPDEVRRLQLSPVMRHSVGFIRTHSSESSRIIKVYKNGHPYDWPLRLCIGRSEFKSLNHLLDHINQRLLISYGARYLFHLDGQLVYSINELKHGHSYLVSGTRHLDLQSSQIIRDSEMHSSSAKSDSQSNSREHLNAKNRDTGQDKLPILVDRNKCQQQLSHKSAHENDDSINNQIGLSHHKTSDMNHEKVPRLQKHRDSADHVNESKTTQSNGSLPSSMEAAIINEQPITRTESKGELQNGHHGNKTNSKAKTREIGINATPETKTFTRKIAQLPANTPTTVSPKSSNASSSQLAEAIVVRDVGAKPRASLIRAKSDTNGVTLRCRKKKNVTFKDTDRGSSPALTSLGLTTTDGSSGMDGARLSQDTFRSSSLSLDGETPSTTMMSSAEMRDIGIQVSDSIEGFLIDLPIALPPSKNELEDQLVGKGRHDYLRRGQGALNRGRGPVGARSPGRAPMAANRGSAKQKQLDDARRPKKIARQIVTITERQLSNDEMIVLKDLDQGDHHHESPPATPPSMLSATSSLIVEPPEDDDRDPLKDVSLYLDETIVPCPPSSSQENDMNKPNVSGELEQQRKGSSGQSRQMKQQTGDSKDQDKAWQIPRGSATPTERPVSQNAANESVHARISTPTPSISTTGGDTTSLSISYETTYNWIQRQQQAEAYLTSGTDSHQQFPLAELPDKERVPILGELCSGTNEPASNFKLVWINGFGINNHHYHHHYQATTVNQQASNSLSPSANNNRATHRDDATLEEKNNNNAFIPSDRTHNWVQHSLKHDEIIYPVGRFVILWCRWTDEQRYYCNHSSNVCALSLGPDETDLAVSAQINEPKENIPAMIHVWSVTKLQLLHKIDATISRDPSASMVGANSGHLDVIRIFSLRLYVSSLPGCLELVAGSCNSKRLWMNHYELRPLAREVDGDDKKAGFKTIETKAFKAIAQQANQLSSYKQVPMVVLSSTLRTRTRKNSLSNADLTTDATVTIDKSSSGEERRMSLGAGGGGETLLFGLGRRLFQVWLLDLQKTTTGSSGVRVLRQLTCDDRNSPFISVISNANCWLPWSQNQLLVGDSEGKVTIVELSLADVGTAHNDSKAPKSPLQKQARVAGNVKAPNKYRIDRVCQILPINKVTNGELSHSQITCLTRISNSLFMTANSNGLVQAWKLVISKQQATNGQSSSAFEVTGFANELKIPEDFGCPYCLVLARYSRSLGQIDFYVASSTNSIMFASLQLSQAHESQQQQQQSLSNAGLSIVYDGHETSAVSLVTECNREQCKKKPSLITQQNELAQDYLAYFTCSLDCKICKWQGKSLVWKSVLPSACASMALHPTGFVLAVGSGDGTIYVLDKVSGLLISYFPLTPVCINCLAYSRDGLLLAAGCSNGSIFILPVMERGLKYNKVSIFQSPYPVLSVQFSWDSKFILTSVTHGLYQELILWDLPNFRYMRNEVTMAADKIRWYDSICSGSEDVRAIWENANMASACQDLVQSKPAKLSIRRQSVAGSLYTNPTQSIVNLSCHRLIRCQGELNQDENEQKKQDLVVASDIRGFVRLFQYPCYDIQQAFYQIRVGSSPVNCCKFLTNSDNQHDGKQAGGLFVSTSVDGAIFVWALCDTTEE